MKKLLPILILLIFVISAFAGINNVGDPRVVTQNAIKTDGSTPNKWVKEDNDSPAQVNTVVTSNDYLSYTTNSDGIVLTLANGTSNVKLFALTGQLLWTGDLTPGRFFIPTRPGIFFLRVNNKSYKVICK